MHSVHHVVCCAHETPLRVALGVGPEQPSFVEEHPEIEQYSSRKRTSSARTSGSQLVLRVTNCFRLRIVLGVGMGIAGAGVVGMALLCQNIGVAIHAAAAHRCIFAPQKGTQNLPNLWRSWPIHPP